MLFKPADPSDAPFLQQMLYEAVFWRASPNRPSYDEAIKLPEVTQWLAGWGQRAGDTAIVALDDCTPIGAAWYRYWSDESNVRGYLNPATPVLVIGVCRQYRRQGVGTGLINQLVQRAHAQAVSQISLMVSKDNPALALYKQQQFGEWCDKGDSLLMLRQIPA